MTTASFVAASENPLIPASYDIIWGTISFLIVLFLFWKFVLPVFSRIVAERHEKIEGGLERADLMQAEAARSKEAYAAQLEEAAKEAAAIRTKAHSEGDEIVNEARAQAVATAEAVAARADEQIAVERAAAVGSLQRDVGDLAVELASKVVGESLQDDARARATVDQFIAELERAAADPGSTTP